MKTNYKTLNPDHVGNFNGRRYNLGTHIVVCRSCGGSFDGLLSHWGCGDNEKMLVRIREDAKCGTIRWSERKRRGGLYPSAYNHFRKTYELFIDTTGT